MTLPAISISVKRSRSASNEAQQSDYEGEAVIEAAAAITDTGKKLKLPGQPASSAEGIQ